jgi:hypothetical protein
MADPDSSDYEFDAEITVLYLNISRIILIHCLIYEFAFETNCQISGPFRWIYKQQALSNILFTTISFCKENGI